MRTTAVKKPLRLMTATTTPDGSSPPGAGEFGRIDRFFKPLAAGFPGARGLADDAAVFAVSPGCELVVTADAMVAGVHFLPDDPPGDIAHKLLAVNLSDLAAKGADPLAYSLTLCLPRGTPDAWVAVFAAGLAEAQARFGIHLSGGDSVSTAGPAVLSVTAFGTVPAGGAPSRDARTDGTDAAGALICVTGTVGDAALGLACVLGGLDLPPGPAREYLIGRLRRPTPRLTEGRALRGLASAMMDVSDGLLGDLAHMARASGCGAVVEAARLPLSDAARGVLAVRPERLSDVLTGGDDYELLSAVRPDRLAAVQATAHVTVIGRLEAGAPGAVRAVDAAGRQMVFDRLGWVHG
jgi:thiamine-monophosphate kinase